MPPYDLERSPDEKPPPPWAGLVTFALVLAVALGILCALVGC